MRVAALWAVCLLLVSSFASGQQTDTVYVVSEAPSPFLLPASGGIIGSGLGTAVGVLVGGWSSDCDDRHSGVYFCGLGEALIGFAVGSTIGSAAGAYLGSRLGGGSPSAVRSLLGGVAGAVVGIALGTAVDRYVEPDAAGFVGYAVGQGLTAGLTTSVWR